MKYIDYACSNGAIYKIPATCCLCCSHCIDILYDYEHGPYTWICELDKDTVIGGAGYCQHFEEETVK